MICLHCIRYVSMSQSTSRKAKGEGTVCLNAWADLVLHEKSQKSQSFPWAPSSVPALPINCACVSSVVYILACPNKLLQCFPSWPPKQMSRLGQSRERITFSPLQLSLFILRDNYNLYFILRDNYTLGIYFYLLASLQNIKNFI